MVMLFKNVSKTFQILTTYLYSISGIDTLIDMDGRGTDIRGSHARFTLLNDSTTIAKKNKE